MSENNLEWDLCIFCQTNSKDEPLQNPTAGKCSISGDRYFTMSSNIQKIKSMKCLPMAVNSSPISEIIARLMKSHQARWHECCSNMFKKL